MRKRKLSLLVGHRDEAWEQHGEALIVKGMIWA